MRAPKRDMIAPAPVGGGYHSALAGSILAMYVSDIDWFSGGRAPRDYVGCTCEEDLQGVSQRWEAPCILAGPLERLLPFVVILAKGDEYCEYQCEYGGGYDVVQTTSWS